jgi:ABC-type antimicrobial peptide transport system permease subunit
LRSSPTDGCSIARLWIDCLPALNRRHDQLESLTWPIQALAVLLALFAVVSLLIAMIGQYAATAFTMRRRVRDFGVRIALGASSHDILASVVREGLVLTAVGLAIGAALSLATASALRSMLFGLTPTDTRTYIGVLALLAAASLFACWLPARRAARIEPMQALRQE